jgi:hypothetical protein
MSPRAPMSDATKAKRAATREANTQARQKVEDTVARDWLTWMKKDAQLYQVYRQSVAMFDARDKEVVKSYSAWVKNKQAQPPVPNDAAVKRIREGA